MHENRQKVMGQVDRILTEVDRLFEGLTTTGRLLTSQGRVWCPPTDVFQTQEDTVVVKIDIAGMRQEDFSVTFSDGTLTVSGTRHDLSEKLAYQRLEIAYGEFMTQVHVPWAVDEDKIEARYQQGFLFVTLPRQPLEETRIAVTVLDDE